MTSSSPERTPITKLAELASVYGGGVIANDRGQGAAGPSYLHEDDIDLVDWALQRIFLEQVTEVEDPEAWRLAREAAQALQLPAPTIVCVGNRGEGSNPLQRIYAV